MGTSTVHRSPSQSPHWRVVNNLYRNPTVQRERLLAEIFKAAERPLLTGLPGQRYMSACNYCCDPLLKGRGFQRELRLSNLPESLSERREPGGTPRLRVVLFRHCKQGPAFHGYHLPTRLVPTRPRSDVSGERRRHVHRPCRITRPQCTPRHQAPAGHQVCTGSRT